MQSAAGIRLMDCVAFSPSSASVLRRSAWQPAKASNPASGASQSKVLRAIKKVVRIG
jgi:hypothetical protein